MIALVHFAQVLPLALHTVPARALLANVRRDGLAQIVDSKDARWFPIVLATDIVLRASASARRAGRVTYVKLRPPAQVIAVTVDCAFGESATAEGEQPPT